MWKFILLGFKVSIFLGASYGALDQMGIFDGRFNGQQLLYYTILSNAVISILYLFLLVTPLFQRATLNEGLDIEVKANTMGALTMMILATGIIYHAVLVPFTDLSQYGGHTVSNFLVHTYVPIAVCIDWIFTKLKEKEMQPIKWLLIPLSYWGLAIIYASFNIPLFKTGSNYAYFFIDADKLGWNKILINILFLSLFFLLLGYFVKGIKLLKEYVVSSK